MIVSNCPRCAEAFRVPDTEVPEDAYAECPWCRETFPLAEVLHRLPPVVHVVSADGRPLDFPARAPAVASGVAPPQSREEAGAFGQPSHLQRGGSEYFEGDVSTLAGVPSEDLENKTVSEETVAETWTDRPVNEEGSLSAEFDIEDPNDTWEEGQPRSAENAGAIAPMRVTPAPVLHRKSKGSAARTVISIVLGALAAGPLAIAILWLLTLIGVDVNLGFWPLNGNSSLGEPQSVAAAPATLSPRREFSQPPRSATDSAIDLDDRDGTQTDREATGQPTSQWDPSSDSDPKLGRELASGRESVAEEDPAETVAEEFRLDPSDDREDTNPPTDSPPKDPTAVDHFEPRQQETGPGEPDFTDPSALDPAELYSEIGSGDSADDGVGPTDPDPSEMAPADDAIQLSDVGDDAVVEQTPRDSADPFAFPPEVDSSGGSSVAADKPGDAASELLDAANEPMTVPPATEDSGSAPIDSAVDVSGKEVASNVEPDLSEDGSRRPAAPETEMSADPKSDVATSATDRASDPGGSAPATSTDAAATETAETPGDVDRDVEPEEVVEATGAALDMLDQLENADRSDPKATKNLLARTYVSVATVGTVADKDSASVRDLLSRVRSSSDLDVWTKACPDWLTYENRPTEGVLLVGKPGVTEAGQTITIVDGTEVSLTKSSPALPQANQVLGLGRIIQSELAQQVRLVAAEPLP